MKKYRLIGEIAHLKMLIENLEIDKRKIDEEINRYLEEIAPKEKELKDMKINLDKVKHKWYNSIKGLGNEP